MGAVGFKLVKTIVITHSESPLDTGNLLIDSFYRESNNVRQVSRLDACLKTCTILVPINPASQSKEMYVVFET